MGCHLDPSPWHKRSSPDRLYVTRIHPLSGAPMGTCVRFECDVSATSTVPPRDHRPTTLLLRGSKLEGSIWASSTRRCTPRGLADSSHLCNRSEAIHRRIRRDAPSPVG